MNHQIQVIRGMHDILPVDMPVWNQLEDCYRKLAESYGYQQIRTPILEKPPCFNVLSVKLPISSRRKCTASPIEMARA